MAIQDTKIVKLETPESETNTDAEQWEYFLQWFAADGGVYSWLFTDFERQKQVTGEVLNDSTNNITKSFQSVNNSVLLTAENLTKNQFLTISQVIKARDIYRIFKNGAKEKIAVLSDTFTYRVTDNRFDYSIQIAEQQDNFIK